MRRLNLLLLVLVLGLPAAAQAAEPPNQNDPCSSGGRDSCGTTGVGSYENYRYGLRWFGDYRGAIPGVNGATFCIDLRYWYPGKEYGYEQRSAANGLKNRDGRTVSQADLRRMSYALWTFGRSQSTPRQAAVMLYVHELMGDGAPGEVDPGAPGVRGLFRAIGRESARLAGPYTVDASVPDDLTVGDEGTLRLKVTSASGQSLEGTKITLGGDGADGLPERVITGPDGTARVPFTATSAKDDLRITATAQDLAAPVPDLYVPTRGKAARNGQRLVAPASKPYRATVSEEVDPVEIKVSTQTAPAAVAVGAESRDEVTITGPGEDWREDVEVRLFGPFRDPAAVTCEGTPSSTTSYKATAGKTTTPPIVLETTGLYAYQLVIPETDDVTGTTTPCPEDSEIVRVQAAPRVVTQVSAPVVEPGAQITDTVTVSGMSGETTTMDAALFGPFGSPSAIVCDQTPIWAQSFPITQDGTFITDPVTLDVPGYYTYKESLAAGDFVMPFETTCAETAETAIVRGHPAIETKVSATAIRPGDELSDTAVVTGLGELDAPVKVELWGPYDSRDDIDCEGAPFATQEFTATGDGEYVTEPVEIARAGFYTYREAIVATDAYDGVQTKCGEAAETSFVQAEPEITTIASDDVVRPGGQLHDRIRISGLGETPARVEVELHGPFQTRAAMDCSGRPAKSQTLRVDGDGVVKSEPVTVAKAGFYTYRERIEAAPGIKAVRTECGVEAETALGRPLILTGRGDDVRDVYGDAAQGDERPAPTQVRYSRLGIQAPVSPIGIDLDSGALGISKNIDKVGWWRDGGAPNDETGATLLAGHVDSAVRGAGAFFALKDARRGDTVRLDVAGGQSKGYRVVKIQRLKKENLPAKVFSRKGPKRLVLVTCGGPFMPDVGHYRDNIIVTAVPR